MDIKILFDKKAESKNLHIGWGLSILVDNKVLFDTGENGKYLLKNMKLIGINPDDIEGIVISHNHWDHTGGLEALLKAKRNQTPVYMCPGFSPELKELFISCGGNPVEVKKWQKIEKNIYITGEIKGIYKGTPMPEQSLIFKTDNGISVITGCAHPGILEILYSVKENFKVDKIYFVMGGFHLLEEDTRTIDFIVKEFKIMGIEKVAPTHCSGEKAESVFVKEYGKNFIELKVGKTIRI
ncbi:MAG: MBL fold metallo-hydrolase [Candidatus Omnitrophica bacterium]|nr:MBL fold metallo-hydrolase [Candidatus Omnitrophota bacterium]MCM8777824.1 MBL fold metallo-hydrolase [Candidatus Omnitrophota bacterium]